MSNPDFHQALRDLAQAEQMRSAGEAARNSRKLLEAQEKQAELEKQKLKIEQIRLQEERERHQVLAKKAEAQKTIRVAMAGVEEEFDLLLRRANSTQESELVDGLSPLSFLAVFAEKRLKLVIQREGQLEDLGDIRFVRSLKQKFHEIREKHPNYFGEAILQRALETMRKIAFWAQQTKCFDDQEISVLAFLNQSDSTIRAAARIELADSINCFDVILKEAGLNKIGVMQEVRAAIAGLELAEAKVLIESAPKALKEGVTKEEAEEIKKKVEAAGAKVKINFKSRLLNISKIEQFIKSIEQLKEKTPLARTRITEAWNLREELAYKLRVYGIADSELTFVFEAALDPTSEKLLARTHSYQARAEDLVASLVHLKMDWIHDKDLFESARKSLAEAKFGEAEKAFKQFKRTTWTDLDVSWINKMLTQKGDSLVQEVEALGSDKTAAINLAQKLAAEYSSSTTIRNALKNYQIKVISELEEQRDRRRRKRMLFAAIVIVLGVTLRLLINKQKSAAERVEEERAASEEIKKTGTVRLPRGAVMRFCYCPPGEFTMGSPSRESGRSEDENQVYIKISEGFWMAETEVTQEQWESLMGSNPSHFKGSTLPVENVSWEDAQKMVEKLNQEVRAPFGYRFSLPSESQWEYACRAGTETAYAFGSELSNQDAKFGGEEKTVSVKSYRPNRWGLYDMHGNVWEWCGDWYGILRGGMGPGGESSRIHRVYRGGSWFNDATACRAAFRYGDPPGYRDSDLGFRPALVPSR